MNAEMLHENYEFNAPPKVVQKMKYREEACNIMWDKRVVRGNTYKSIISQQETVVQTTVKRIKPHKVVTEKREDETLHHEETQTDPNVEELTDKPPRHQKETQTEFVIEKVVPRLYMKVKTGTDVETQIWDDGELFNFEYEAEPILQVLVQKTLDLSRMEVLQEEELREMKEQQEHYHRLRKAELAEQDRLEKKEQQLYNENIKLKQQYHNQKQKDVKTHEKLVCRVLAKQFTSRTQGNALERLIQAGFFRDAVEVELIKEYLPWIYSEVKEELGLSLGLETDVEGKVGHILGLVASVDNLLFEEHKKVLAQERDRRANVLREREEARLAKEEDLRQRRERRKIRLEKERRQKLKDQVVEQLLSKGEERDALAAISDIDGYGQGAPFIGHLGGFIGEMIIFVNAVLLNGQQFEAADIADFVSAVIGALPETSVVELGLRESIDQLLAEIDPELNLTNLPETLTPQMEQAFLKSVTFSIEGLLDELQHVQPIFNSVVKTLLETRAKVRFVKAKGAVDFNKLPCLIRIGPSLEALPFHAKSGKSRPERQPDEDQTEEEIVINPRNLAEAAVDQRATACPNANEELQIVIIHEVAQFYARQIATVQFGEVELPYLIEIIDKCNTIEQGILEKANQSLAQIDINQY